MKPRYRSLVFRFGRWFLLELLTRPGRWFVVPSFAFLVWSMTRATGQVFLPGSYALAIWVAAFAAAVIWRPRVRVWFGHPERIGAGETLPIDVEVEAVGRLAERELRILAEHPPPGARPAPPGGTEIQRLDPGRTARVRFGLLCERRGAWTLGGLRVSSAFPFGLARGWRVFPKERRVLVYPRFAPLARLEVPVGQRYQPGGVALASVVGESAEYVGNREYREGDRVRDIDWRATARLQRPVVREYRQEYFLRVAVVLDTQVRLKAAAARTEDFERAVSVCAAVGDRLARQEYVVDLFAAGPNLYHLVAGRSLAYLDQILDILACVESTAEEPFPVIAPELMENLSRISTVVCVFLDWDDSRRAFADGLRRQGVGVKAVIVRSGACTLDPAPDSGWLGGATVLDGAAGPPVEL